MAGLLGSLESLIPGAAGMSPEDKRALITQGLLSAGLGILSNNQGHYGKAGPAIGAGLMGGLGAINSGAQSLADNRYKQQVMERQMGDPSEFRAMDLMARAAGHAPGSQGYKDFFRRNNGEIARQSSAAIQYRTETGSDGVPRIVAYDPRTVGAQVVGDGTTYGSGVGAPDPQQDFPALASNFGAQITSLQRTPQHNREVGGVPNSQHLTGTAGDFVVPPQAKPGFIAAAQQGGYQAIDEGDHIHLELPPRPLSKPKSTGANPFVGRRKEDEAAAVKAAEKSAELAALPAELQLRTNAAITQAGGTTAASEQAKTDADANRNLPKVEQAADLMLDTIGKLENHPGLSIITGMSGVLDPRNYMRGSRAQGAQALADQIQGQTFLQAYQTLKGGGQITEVEGKKAEAAMARLNTAQSEDDYRLALRDLREVIEAGLVRAQVQATGGQPKAAAAKASSAANAKPGGSLKRFNPATGKIE